MKMTDISPDQIIFWRWGALELNATIVYTWGVMLVLAVVIWLGARNLRREPPFSRWQMLLEVVVLGMRDHVRTVSHRHDVPYFDLVASLFLFIATSNLLDIVPGFYSPMGSLSTTAALAAAVFLAVPAYGIAERGLGSYFKRYVEPTVFMLPFHVLGELSRTLALAVRLFGNVMSGTKIAIILLAVVPFLFPVVMQVLSLLTGLLHAYIFALLATVYIASASSARERSDGREEAHTRVQEGGS
jgi:F-type H+-transporting ATPase subunit a